MANGIVRANVMTPQQIASRRQVGGSLIKSGLENRGRDALGALAQMAQTAAGAFITGRANEAEAARQSASRDALAALAAGSEGTRPGAGFVGPMPRRPATAADFLGHAQQFPEDAALVAPFIEAALAPQDPKFLNLGDGRALNLRTGEVTRVPLSPEQLRQEKEIRAAGRPQTTVNVGPTGVDYGDPPKDHAWARNPDGTVMTEVIPEGQVGAGSRRPVPVPIGEALREQQEAEAKTEARKEQKSERSQIMFEDLKVGLETLAESPFLGAGLGAQLTSWIGSTPGRRVASSLQTLKSNISLDELQRMRDNSPTGGALGNVSNAEGDRLAAAQGDLDQFTDAADLERKMRRVGQTLLSVIHGGPEALSVAGKEQLRELRDLYEFFSPEDQAAITARVQEIRATEEGIRQRPFLGAPMDPRQR